MSTAASTEGTGTGAGATTTTQGAGATAVTTQTGGAGAAAAPVATDWTTGLPDEARGYVQNKGWKAPGDLLTSYQNLEKLHGVPETQILKLPKDDTDVEGWNKVFGRLGRPESPDGYQIQAPKEGGNPEFVKWASGAFHELGLTTKQAQALAGKWNGYVDQMTKAQSDAGATKVQQEAQALQKEWGAAYEQNSRIVDQAAQAFGMNEKQLTALREAMGPAAAMKFMHAIGTKMGEHEFVTGGKQNGFGHVLSPEAAHARLGELRQDKEWVGKYLSGDSNAKREMEQLQRWANPE